MFKKKDQKLADSVIQKDVQCTGFIRAVKDETKNAPASAKQSNDWSSKCGQTESPNPDLANIETKKPNEEDKTGEWNKWIRKW